MQTEQFELKYGSKNMVGSIIPAGSNPDLFILHGGGGANIGRYAKLRELLAEKGISSCAFDYPGHGATGGSLVNSSLQERTEVTREVMNQLGLQPRTIIGSSMGAYTAVRLLEYYPIDNLILLVPAIYSNESYNLQFGLGFKDEITKPESWDHSVAWKLLESFQGNLLLVTAEHDKVIPKEVIDKNYSLTRNCLKKEKYMVKNAHHGFTRFLNDRPEQLKELVQVIVRFTIN